MLGQAAAMEIRVEELQQRLARESVAAQSLAEVGFSSIVSLLATYCGQNTDLAPWLQDAEINQDRSLRLQFLAGLGVNRHESGAIYNEMLGYRRFPGKLFIASEIHERMLRRLIEPPKSRP